jgi:hypothetical protein
MKNRKDVRAFGLNGAFHERLNAAAQADAFMSRLRNS